MSSVQIQVIHDFACPWCRIAEANLHTALAASGIGPSAVVAYRPFELDPSLPATGVDTAVLRSPGNAERRFLRTGYTPHEA